MMAQKPQVWLSPLQPRVSADRAHSLQVSAKAFPRSILSSPVPSLFFPQEDKQPAQGTHMPRTGCVILLSQFTKQKHSVSLHLIRKLARRPGWSGFSYAGVRHVLSFSSSWPPWWTETGKEGETALEPSLAWTLPSVEQGSGNCTQTGQPWASTCTSQSFPVERASPGGSPTHIQLLGRRENHFPAPFPHFSQKEQIHINPPISILTLLLQAILRGHLYIKK